MRNRRIIVLAAALALLLGLQSCATLEQIAGALVNLQRLKFKLGAVHDFSAPGDQPGREDAADRLHRGARGCDWPRGSRPSGCRPSSSSTSWPSTRTTARAGSKQTVTTLTGLESRLLVDGKPTITGNIDRPIEIPGTGRESILGIRLGIDLYEFFGQGGYNDLLGLALAIGGRSGSASRLSLDALPTVTTPFGPITYPNRITIVSHEFR